MMSSDLELLKSLNSISGALASAADEAALENHVEQLLKRFPVLVLYNLALTASTDDESEVAMTSIRVVQRSHKHESALWRTSEACNLLWQLLQHFQGHHQTSVVRIVRKAAEQCSPQLFEDVSIAISTLIDFQWFKDIGVADALGESLVHGFRTGSVPPAAGATALAEAVQRSGHGPQLPTWTDKHVVSKDIFEARVHFIVTAVVGASEDAGAQVVRQGLLQPLFDVMIGDDLLLQMTSLEVLPHIAGSNAGLVALAESGVLEKLVEWVGLPASVVRPQSATELPIKLSDCVRLDAMMGVSAFRCLGEIVSIALAKQTLCRTPLPASDDCVWARASTWRAIAVSLLEAAAWVLDNESDPEQLLSAMQFVADVLAADPGLLAQAVVASNIVQVVPAIDRSLVDSLVGKVAYELQAYLSQSLTDNPSSAAEVVENGARLRHVLRAYAELFVSTAEVVRVACVHQCTRLLARNRSLVESLQAIGLDVDSAALSEMTRLFYIAIGHFARQTTTTDIVMTQLRTPIEAPRLALLGLMCEVIRFPAKWAVQHIVGTPEVVEMLVDRRGETSHACNQTKVDIVAAALKHPQIRTLGELTTERLRSENRQQHAASEGPGTMSL